MSNYQTIQGVRMAVIPAGKFLMGHEYRPDPAIPPEVNVYNPDEQPVHEETLTAFQLGATQVTQAQYEQVMKVNFSSFKGADLPVTNLGPVEIKAFCNALSKAAGLDPCYQEAPNTGGQGRGPQQPCDPTKNGFRLPFEREWEYACRAGTRTMFNTGNSEADLARAGWYRGNSGGRTHPVGQKTPNTWGLYDMHGNVFEFCEDDWNPSMAYSRYLPTGAAPDFNYYHTLNLARGGGWFSDAAVCRSATRSCFCNWQNINQSYYMGFRLARSAS